MFVIALIGWYFPYASEILRRRPKPTPRGENCWNDLRRRGDCVIVCGLLERRCPVAALVSTACVYGRLVARVLQQTAATINFRIVAEFPSGHWCRTVTTRAHVLVLLAFPAVSRHQWGRGGLSVRTRQTLIRARGDFPLIITRAVPSYLPVDGKLRPHHQPLLP